LTDTDQRNISGDDSKSVSWSVIIIVISNLVMSIVEREPSGFRIIGCEIAHHYSVLALIWLTTYMAYVRSYCMVS